MSIRDVAARNASLDNDYGTTRGPNAAGVHALALFRGDPMFVGSAEVTGPGYARGSVAAADWLPAADGAKSSEPVPMGVPTGPWDEATHWALFDGSVMWDCAPLSEVLQVTGAGPAPRVSVTVFYAGTTEEV